MSKFYKGAKVRCIDASYNKMLRKGAEYIVQGVSQGCCGKELLDVGLNTHEAGMRCGICGKHTADEGEVAWFRSARFELAQGTSQSNEMVEVSFTEVRKANPLSAN